MTVDKKKTKKPRAKKPKADLKQKQKQSQTVNINLASPKRRASKKSAEKKTAASDIPRIYAPQAVSSPAQIDYVRIGDMIKTTAKSLVQPEQVQDSKAKPVVAKEDNIRITEKPTEEQPVYAEAAYYPRPKRVNVRKPLTDEQRERKRAADRQRYIRKRESMNGQLRSVPSQEDLAEI
jgi:hypothetical protein